MQYVNLGTSSFHFLPPLTSDQYSFCMQPRACPNRTSRFLRIRTRPSRVLCTLFVITLYIIITPRLGDWVRSLGLGVTGPKDSRSQRDASLELRWSARGIRSYFCASRGTISVLKTCHVLRLVWIRLNLFQDLLPPLVCPLSQQTRKHTRSLPPNPQHVPPLSLHLHLLALSTQLHYFLCNHDLPLPQQLTRRSRQDMALFRRQMRFRHF